jgi:hypothetical protein
VRKYLELALVALFVGTLFFWVKGGDNFDQLWMQRWAILLLGSSGVVAFAVGRSVGWAFAPAVFFSLFSGLITSFWFTRYDNAMMERIATGISNPYWFDSEAKWTMQAILRQDASRAIFALAILLLAQRCVSVGWATRVRTLLGLCGFAQALIIIANYSHASQWIFYSGNPSMGGAFVALSLWMLDGDISRFFRTRAQLALRCALWGVGITAIFLTNATTPLLGLAGGGVGYLFARSIPKWRKSLDMRAHFVLYVGLSSLLVLGVFGAGYLLQGPELWNDTYRFRMWRWMYEFWARQDLFTKAFGFGTGTMRTFLPVAQVEHGESKFWLFYLHNDWYTWLPELGVVGLVANVIAALEVLRRSLSWPHFTACFTCFGAIMLTGFPLHWPVFVLALVMLVRPFMETKKLFAEKNYRVVTAEELKMLFPRKEAQ